MVRTLEFMSSSLVVLGRALSDQSRVTMLLELFDHPGATLGVLASAAGIASSTASEHLDHLEDAGLITRVKTGRSISVHFAEASAAAMIEQLLAHNRDDLPSEPTTKIGRLRCARTCYDHLAGRLGVHLSDLLVDVGVLDLNFVPTSSAQEWLAQHFDLDLRSLTTSESLMQLADRRGLSGGGRSEAGIEPGRVKPSKRPLVRSCLDWTEQRPHIAGLLGTELLHAFLRNGWIARHQGDRSIRITMAGQHAFEKLNLIV